jgi:hypothetical protein
MDNPIHTTLYLRSKKPYVVYSFPIRIPSEKLIQAFCGVLYLAVGKRRQTVKFLRCTLPGRTTGRGSPPPLPLRVAKTGRNHLNEELTPLLPTGIGERF